MWKIWGDGWKIYGIKKWDFCFFTFHSNGPIKSNECNVGVIQWHLGSLFVWWDRVGDKGPHEGLTKSLSSFEHLSVIWCLFLDSHISSSLLITYAMTMNSYLFNSHVFMYYVHTNGSLRTNSCLHIRIKI